MMVFSDRTMFDFAARRLATKVFRKTHLNVSLLCRGLFDTLIVSWHQHK